MPRKSADQWFAEYGESHQNHANELIHWICVPVIFFSVLGFIWAIPVPASWEPVVPWFNWSLVAIVAAFFIAFAAGWLTEWALIRHLYKRPLDTLLATWGLSLGLQQVFRSTFGPKEVSPTLPDWLMGSWAPAEGLDIPINGLFVMGLTAVVTAFLLLALYKARWGLRVRATVSNRVMANAIGINTKKTDRLTFAIGCGIAGVAGAAFTTIGSTGPTSGSLYIVDSFLVVTFGGAGSLLGTVASAFGIAQTQSISEFFMSGSNAKVLTLMTVITILMLRPQGLFASKVRR